MNELIMNELKSLKIPISPRTTLGELTKQVDNAIATMMDKYDIEHYKTELVFLSEYVIIYSFAWFYENEIKLGKVEIPTNDET